MWSQRPAVQLQSGVLVRKLDQTVQLIVPDISRKRLFDQAHAGPLAAHLGVDKTLQQLKQSYYWPGMRRDINLWYSTCEKCARSKRGHLADLTVNCRKFLPVLRLTWLQLTFCLAPDGSKHLLVVVDCFSKWVEEFPLPDQEASTCMRARPMYNGFLSRFGLPRQLHSDQG